MKVFDAFLIQRIDLGNVHIDRLDHRGLLLGCRGDRLVHAVDFTNALGHADQALAGAVGDFHAVLAVTLAFFHGAHRATGADLQFLDHFLHLLRRFLGAVRQIAHFIRDYGKAAAGFACAGRFDGRVQRQQVGLLGNAGDHFQDLADVHGLVIQRLDMTAGRAKHLRQFLHRIDAALDHLLAFFGQTPCVAGLVRGLGGVAGDLLCGGTQFVDGCCDTVGTAGLLV